MIVDAFLEVIAGAISGILGLMPTFDLPEWFSSGPVPDVTDMGDIAGFFGGHMANLKNWIDVGPALDALPIIVTVLLFVLGVKLVRLVLSLISGGGGGGVST